ncbi:MAG: c-type cytochrome [Rhodocyclales bacterium]|nr:c-type cytochrome [Rhodocyclales bacterium]
MSGWKPCLAALSLLTAAVAPAAAEAVEPAALFATHCASCHGANRFGIMGPALLPESLERLRKPEALKTIRDGRAATQMAGFADKLKADEIAALADFIYTAALPPPAFTEADIMASRLVHHAAGSLPDRPDELLQGRDLMNLFLVVEVGDHHVSILDGDKLEPIHRFQSRYALHGGPKFTADGRYVFFASRDGWISKFDIWNQKTTVEIRVGINTRNLAVSADGKWIMAANYLPNSLVLLDANLNLVKVMTAGSRDGKLGSRVSAVYDAAPRRSFVVAMKDIAELWEISYDTNAAPIFDGYVHDYQMGEAIALTGFQNARRTLLESPLDDFYFDATYANVMGASRQGKAQVVNLDIRRKIADLELSGMPHLGSGITWNWRGRTVMASPNLKDGAVTVIDMKTWQTITSIATLGPGFFTRSHENSRFAWVDSMMSSNKDTLQVIDKSTLQRVAELRPEKGKTLAHVEFTRDGRYALASLMERRADGGALIVFDAETFKEVKRIPMDKPVGKYNLYNKINRSEGTSH